MHRSTCVVSLPCRPLCTVLKDCLHHTANAFGIIAHMKKHLTRIILLLLAAAIGFAAAGCAAWSPSASTYRSDDPISYQAPAISVTEDGEYSDKDSVALYIHTYGHLPGNFISKTKARKAGWNSDAGNLWDVLPGKSIGGSEFYNDEGMLPEAQGRRWTECDIDYAGGYRNAKRLVFSNDGLIYYTPDHYRTYERLY